MNLFHGHKIPTYKTDPILGSPIRKGVRGTPNYFIKELTGERQIEQKDLVGAKGLFQLYQKGLLLRIYKNTNTWSLAIPFSEISKLRLTKGVETIRPRFMRPMWILLNLGVHKDVARYFAQYWGEYKIEDALLQINTECFSCELTTSSYTFNAQENFFSRLDLAGKIEILKSPSKDD